MARQTQQPFDAASQIGAEASSANRQPAEPLSGHELSAQPHETVGQCLGSAGDHATGLVGRRLTGRVQSVPCPPHRRMPPEDRTQQIGAQLPRRIARGEMGQLVGQHRILLVPVEILGKPCRQCDRRAAPTESDRRGQPPGLHHADRSPQSESTGQCPHAPAKGRVGRFHLALAKGTQPKFRAQKPSENDHRTGNPQQAGPPAWRHFDRCHFDGRHFDGRLLGCRADRRNRGGRGRGSRDRAEINFLLLPLGRPDFVGYQLGVFFFWRIGPRKWLPGDRRLCIRRWRVAV